jgi:hypothetical protein
MARAACTWLDAALAKNLPHRSRENEFTDGRVEFLLFFLLLSEKFFLGKKPWLIEPST